MDIEAIRENMSRYQLTQSAVAEALGISPDKVSKSLSGVRRFTAQEVAKLNDLLATIDHSDAHPDLTPTDLARDYLVVPVLPSFAGMGGGGNGEGEPEIGMVPRRLVEDELRARVSDLILIEARGDSMQPDFQHGDQILIDKRDRNPAQPGPFALFDGDAYVIKLVERVPGKRGTYRVFSANERYSAYEVEETENTIMGRPVWFARRL